MPKVVPKAIGWRSSHSNPLLSIFYRSLFLPGSRPTWIGFSRHASTCTSCSDCTICFSILGSTTCLLSFLKKQTPKVSRVAVNLPLQLPHPHLPLSVSPTTSNSPLPMSSHSHRSSQIWTCVHISKGCGMFGWKPHPSPWHRIPKGFVMFGSRLHPKLSSMELPQSRFCPLENLPNNDSFPRDTPDHSCRVFKLSLREQTLDFLVFPSHLLSGGLESHLGVFYLLNLDII